MKTTWKIWAAALMTMLGVIPVGCGGSVIVDGQDPACPAAAPKVGAACDVAVSGCVYTGGPCKETLSCGGKSGAWQSTAVTCSPTAKACSAAADGDVCAVVGESCGEGPSACSYFTNTCGADHLWHTLSASPNDCCAPGSGVCPTAPPQEGAFCDACNGATNCNYPGTCGGVYASCAPEGVWHLAIGDCPPPPPLDYCMNYGSQTGCETDPGCRWLTPGCNPTGLTLTGCFSAVECTGASCGPGSGCQQVSYNPCFGKNCDACGADTLVCIPYVL
jgi:hypothetical protein